MKNIGKVLWWNERDGFGVIEDTIGNEFYFDTSVVDAPRGLSIARDQIVTFSQNRNVNDCLCADDVRVPRVSETRRIATRYMQQIESVA